MNLSILGTNCNGLNGKTESLKNAIKQFGQPSFVTLQETKLKCNNFKIPGYQVFQQNRNSLGGGLLTAVNENLGSTLVSSTESEILVIQTKIDQTDLRIINAYGPQELDAEKENIFRFWQDLEKEVISAKDQNCGILIQMDANAKVGYEVIRNDPNQLSNNGRVLLELVERQQLSILNANELCEGVITRHRKTVIGEEKSVIDYVIVCDLLLRYLQQMLIDEDRKYVLTKYNRKHKSESDHNLMFAKFSLTYIREAVKTKQEIFNFKNREFQNSFFEVTDRTTKLSGCFQSNSSFLSQSNKFFKTLNQTFHQSYKKIRMTNNSDMKNEPTEEVQNCLDAKVIMQAELKFANLKLLSRLQG